MKKLCLALLLAVVAANALAQETISVQAVPVHRFITQNESLGHFLTSNFAEGSGFPYNYRYQPFPYQADIVPVVPGYTPRADQGLTPLYRWQVDERPRIYYYYSIFYYPHGGNYRFQGIAGYVMASNDPRGTPKHYYYSTSYGYYYTLTGEYPPCCSFSYHGTSYNFPVGGSYTFEKIPVIEEPCPGREWERDNCINNGNTWSDESCSCQFVCQWCDQPVQ